MLSICAVAQQHEGFRLLFQAHEYATELGLSVWDFAVDIESLRAAGFTNNDLRWLICNRYVEHRREVRNSNDFKREFRECSGWTFFKRSCFVLTSDGLQFFQTSNRPVLTHATKGAFELARPFNSNRLPDQYAANGGLNGSTLAAPVNGAGSRLPNWDAARQELRVGELLVKQFRLPSPNQGTVLMVFEEEGWPARIDDPLPPHPDIDPKRRLHDTIKSLNRNQKNKVLRFKGDGSGVGVLWEFAAAHRNGKG
ncbi:MAG: hypothetical protein KDA42_15105 [Planctomycetales bacterium]|nr:hypothetical protein [Planctomycetales bacterium]